MSVFLKYDFNSNFAKQQKLYTSGKIIQKFYKPFKTPVRLAYIYIGFIYLINEPIYFKKIFKSLTNINLTWFSFSHYSTCFEFLVK